jgi:hypothetical protein
VKPAAAAIAAARRAAEALRCGVGPAEREQLLDDIECALEVLAAGRRRASSLHLAERVARLERQLADRTPGERREVICTRLGLSKASYYRLRQVAHASRSDETCAR